MARDGRYRSQFETGTSNGGLTAFPGGDRWAWESRIFGGAYDRAPAAERPKYGSLNFRRRAAGGSPRFGSAHFRLKPEMLDRTTFCYPDSFLEPTDFGVASAMPLIALAGFWLSIVEMRRHLDYRGAEFVELGCSLATDGYLDPRIIGDAARTGRYDEQALKRVWHYVARYGFT